MKRSAAGVVAVLALVALSACVKYKFGELGPLEAIAVRVHMEGGTCKFEQPVLGDVRTQQKRTVTWFVVGECPGYDIEIAPTFTKQGENHTLIQINGSVLRASLGSDKGLVTLTARLNATVEKGLYGYKMRLIASTERAEAWVAGRGEEKDGSFFACPVWPCGGFKDY